MPSIDVPVQTPRNQYIASASQTVFSYTFLIFSSADIVVVQNGTELTLTTHYTVANVGTEGGGDVTLVTGATEDDVITIYRQTQIGRDSQYQQDGTFDAAPLEADFDTVFTILQENRRDIDRAFTMDIEDEDTVTTVPAPSARKALVWNAAANQLENSTYDPDDAETAAVAAAASASAASSSASSASSSASASSSSASAASDSADAAAASAASIDPTKIESADTNTSIVCSDGDPIDFTAPDGVDLNGADIIAGGSGAFDDVVTGDVTGFRKIGTAITDTDQLSIAEHANLYNPFTGAASKTITLPANATEAFVVGTEIEIFNRSANEVTLTAAASVIVNGVTAGSLGLASYQGCVFKKVATNTWDFCGPNADSWA